MVSASFCAAMGILWGWLWADRGMILRWSGKDFGTILVWFSDDFGMVLECFWHYFGMSSVWFWNDFGMILAWFGNDFGMDSHFALEAFLISMFCYSGLPNVHMSFCRPSWWSYFVFEAVLIVIFCFPLCGGREKTKYVYPDGLESNLWIPRQPEQQHILNSKVRKPLMPVRTAREAKHDYQDKLTNKMWPAGRL